MLQNCLRWVSKFSKMEWQGLRTHHRQIPINIRSRPRDLGLCVLLPLGSTRYRPLRACQPGNYHARQLRTPRQSQSTDIPIPPMYQTSVVAQQGFETLTTRCQCNSRLAPFFKCCCAPAISWLEGKSEMICSRVQPPLKILVLESLKLHLRLGTRPLSVL